MAFPMSSDSLKIITDTLLRDSRILLNQLSNNLFKLEVFLNGLLVFVTQSGVVQFLIMARDTDIEPVVRRHRKVIVV